MVDAIDDVLCDRNKPWEDYGSTAIRRCVRNDAIVEILFRAGQLAKCMPDNAPDQEHLDRLHRALTDAATAMQAALKPYADPVV